MVDVTSVIPDAIVDLRYATADNFVGKPLYPADAHCLVHESLAPGLVKAADVFRFARREAGVLGLLPPARRAGRVVRRRAGLELGGAAGDVGA